MSREEDRLIEVLDELILHEHFQSARRILKFAEWTFSRHDEYLKKVQDAEKSHSILS